VPQKRGGEEEQWRGHPAPALVQRAAPHVQDQTEPEDEGGYEQDDVETERLAAKQHVAPDAQYERRSRDADADPALMFHTIADPITRSA
jgi:hypothetical protein